MERKEELASLDVFYLCRELSERLAGGSIKKIYQNEGSFLFSVRGQGREDIKLYADAKKAFLAGQEFDAPAKPPSFCMLLRKHLSGKRIVSVSQPGFERIVEIRTAESRLVIELIRPGNIILVDNEGAIIMPLKTETYRDRTIAPKARYLYPPKAADPISMEFNDFMRQAGTSDRNLASFLAAAMGFGGAYANEICDVAGMQATRPVKLMEKGELFAVFGAMKSLFSREIIPSIYEDVFVSPFEMKSMGDKSVIHISSFSEAISSYFGSTAAQKQTEKEEEREEKLGRIEESRRLAMKKWEERAAENSRAAQLIYKNYPLAKGIIEALRKGRERNIDWKAIKERVAKRDTPETAAIKEIREHEGMVVLNLEGAEIGLDFTKSIEENAAQLFEGAKKAKKKMEGVEKSMGTAPAVKGAKPERKKRAAKKWHEQFRHFTTTDGFLVVAGKNAQENETLFRKYLKKGDLAFHADIQGAGLIVIRAYGKQISPEARREAAEFAAVHSKAWKAGIGNVNVYAVKPEQMGKKDPAGHPLPKGGFSLSGGREWFRDIELKLAVGVGIDRENNKAELICGPVIAVRRHAKYFTTIKPGNVEAHELAKMIRNRLLLKSSFEDKPLAETIPLEEIQSAIPSGVGSIIDFG